MRGVLALETMRCHLANMIKGVVAELQPDHVEIRLMGKVHVEGAVTKPQDLAGGQMAGRKRQGVDGVL